MHIHLLPGAVNLDVDSPNPDNEKADQEHEQDDTTSTDNAIVSLMPWKQKAIPQ